MLITCTSEINYQRVTNEQKQIWIEVRERFVKAIETRVHKSQADCIIVYNLHFAIFGKPKYKPNTTCDFDYMTWKLIIENLEGEFKAL